MSSVIITTSKNMVYTCGMVNKSKGQEAMETIGQRIARLRLASGYTQKELAQKIGKGQKLISDFERGRFTPSPDLTVHLAQALGITTDELLGVRQAKKQQANPSKKLIRRMKELETLPPAQQKFILRTIDTLIKATAQK